MSSTQQRQRAWAYLSRTIEGPSRPLQALLQQGRAPEAIAQGLARREPWLGELLRSTESRYQQDQSAQDIEAIKRLGGRLLTPDDAEWPGAIFEQTFGFAASGCSEHVRSYADDAVAPHALWVLGQPLQPLLEQSITVVGTRAVSSYGSQVTTSIVQHLVAHHWVIVSGGALGVDTVAHQAALAAGGATVMVAACGLDRTYPARNAALFEKIRARGALVSEYPPGMTPHRHRFLTRNRLVAAFGRGTVVTEAAWRSGALNTLAWAQGLGRVAMAVPGPVHNVGSLGCHEKIRQGVAQLVCSGQEVRGLVEKLGAVDVDGQYELDFAADPIQRLPRNELRVFDALSSTPQPADAVAANAGLSTALTMHLLVTLEQRNLVARNGTTWVRMGKD